ncbi:MAG: outer membrane beta-barrel protein [Planctomycetota bacterium]
MRRTTLLIPFALTSALHASTTPIDANASLLLDETPEPQRDPLAYRAAITPIVWWSALSAEIEIAPNASFNTQDFDADEPTIAVGGEARIDTERLTFALAGFHRSDDLDNIAVTDRVGPIAPGSRADWEIDFTSVSFTAGYRFEDLLPEDDVGLRFDVYGGVRAFDVDFTIASGANTLGFDESWATPVVGGRMRLELPHDFDLLVDADIGFLPLGDTTTSTWSIFAGFGYHPTPNLGVRVGFRHLAFRYLDESGDADDEFRGFLAGLYAGVVIRF